MRTVLKANLTLLLAAGYCLLSTNLIVSVPVQAEGGVPTPGTESSLAQPSVASDSRSQTNKEAAGKDSQEDTAKDKANTESEDPRRPYKDEAIRRYNHGHDLHQQGFFNQAIAEYKSAIAADDRMEEAWTNLGLIYAAQRNYSKAIDAFKKSLLLRPTRPNALNGLGTVLYANKKFSEAMEKWREAVKIDPRFASAYYNMGNALENEKDYPGAVDNYAHALAVNPAMADAYYRIGSIYAKQKHTAQANLLLSKAIQLEPSGAFVHDAKRVLDSMEGELTREDSQRPEVKMNIMAPPAPGAGENPQAAVVEQTGERPGASASTAAPEGVTRTDKPR